MGFRVQGLGFKGLGLGIEGFIGRGFTVRRSRSNV
jgi:hypothetical protein